MNKKPDYARYEAMKQTWLMRNPKASTSQYEQAMRRIAAECGI